MNANEISTHAEPPYDLEVHDAQPGKAGDRDHHVVHVSVTFPASKHRPFDDKFPPTATVGSVRIAAMSHFQVADDDPQYEYYLTANRQRQDDSSILQDIAGHDHRATFRLVKDLRQG